MTMSRKTARVLLVSSLILIAIGMGMFLFYPLRALGVMAVGIVVVIFASSKWAKKPLKEHDHNAPKKQRE